MTESVVESQFAPPLVVLGCVPARARCAEARVLHLLSQTRPSRRRTTSLCGRGKDRADRSRRVRSVLFGTARPSINDNQRQSSLQKSPFSKAVCGSEDRSRFSRENRERKEIHVKKRKRADSPIHESRHARVSICTRKYILGVHYRCYRSTNEADRKCGL